MGESRLLPCNPENLTAIESKITFSAQFARQTMYKFDDKDAASPAVLRNSISDAGKKAEPSSVINSMIISDVN